MNRETRKALPGHKPGTEWKPDEWEAFKVEAVRCGGSVLMEGTSCEHVAWYSEDSKYHREDGPAVVWPYGYEGWWQNGKLHRLGGPARLSEFTKEWWREGVRYADETFTEALRINHDEP